MTVSELIAMLQALKSDMEVKLISEEGEARLFAGGILLMSAREIDEILNILDENKSQGRR